MNTVPVINDKEAAEGYGKRIKRESERVTSERKKNTVRWNQEKRGRKKRM